MLQDGAPCPVPVTVGIAGTRYTEVWGPALREGMRVLTGTESAKAAPAAGSPLGGPPPR